MAGEVVPINPRVPSLDDLRGFAEAAVKSKFYGFTSADQMLPLMIVAQSQGRSFASVVEEYSIIQGRPALKSEAMLARFQKAGGHIKWTALGDERCAAIFSHAQCDPVEIDWDLNRAKQAGIGGKDNWKKYPRNMLKARVISDGVRTAFPACLGGMYTPEEAMDFEPAVHVPRAALIPGEAPGPTGAGEPSPAPAPVEALTKAKARPEFAALQEGIRTCTSTVELASWAAANAGSIATQPDDWKDTLRQQYADMKRGLEDLEYQARASAEADAALEGAG